MNSLFVEKIVMVLNAEKSCEKKPVKYTQSGITRKSIGIIKYIRIEARLANPMEIMWEKRSFATVNCPCNDLSSLTQKQILTMRQFEKGKRKATG